MSTETVSSSSESASESSGFKRPGPGKAALFVASRSSASGDSYSFSSNIKNPLSELPASNVGQQLTPHQLRQQKLRERQTYATRRLRVATLAVFAVLLVTGVAVVVLGLTLSLIPEEQVAILAVGVSLVGCCLMGFLFNVLWWATCARVSAVGVLCAVIAGAVALGSLLRGDALLVPLLVLIVPSCVFVMTAWVLGGVLSGDCCTNACSLEDLDFEYETLFPATGVVEGGTDDFNDIEILCCGKRHETTTTCLMVIICPCLICFL